MYDDPVINDVNENINDDITDTLTKILIKKIGRRLGCSTNGNNGASSPRIRVTPGPDIYKSTHSHRNCVTPIPVEKKTKKKKKRSH